MVTPFETDQVNHLSSPQDIEVVIGPPQPYEFVSGDHSQGECSRDFPLRVRSIDFKKILAIAALAGGFGYCSFILYIAYEPHQHDGDIGWWWAATIIFYGSIAYLGALRPLRQRRENLKNPQ